MKIFSVFALLLFSGVEAIPQEAQSSLRTIREPVTIPKLTSAPVIDGKLDEEVWRQAVVLNDLIQISPGDHIPPSKPTEVYIAYDEKFLYVAFKCWDEKEKIRASVVERDNVFGEDNVRFWLDTYGDRRRAYVFGSNPLGIQQDGVETEGQGTDYNVDVLFESKGVIEEWGWSVEFKIPFKSIRYVAGKGKFWGFNASRNIYRLNDEFISWVPLERGNPNSLSQFGKITGLDEIKEDRTLEVIPTLTFKQTGKRTSLNHFSNPPIEPDFGFTAKYSITPNITLDMAYNPDFADTEADAPVVEANQRFPIFFSEKRPFFLEGVDIFRTPIQAVYTRRVQNPDIAIKLSGKAGKNSFGILGAIDDPLFNPLDKKAFAGVVRAKTDVGKDSEIGFLATAYSYPQKNNYVAGFDTRWKINSRSTFTGQVLGSTSRNFFYDPNTDRAAYQTGNGASYSYQYTYNAKNYNWGISGNNTTARFRADMGFTDRTDSMNNFVYGSLSSEPKPNAFIIAKNLRTSFVYRNDFSGRFKSWGESLNGNLILKNNTGIGGGISIGREKIYEDEFGPTRNGVRNGAFFGAPEREALQFGASTYFYKEFNKRFSVDSNFSVSFNDFDFDFGAGPSFPRVSPAALALGPGAPLDPGKANNLYFGLSTDIKPSDNLSFEVGYDRSQLKRRETNLFAYKSNSFSFVSTYQFSQHVNVKARIYYDTLSDEILGQYTFSWTPSVGKALYIGYNDNSTYRGYAFGQEQPGYLQLNRTFFIKMSYLFRKSF
jgi:hypothetical protein